jgi:hypothetical protein
MEIDSANFPAHLVEANIVETLEARSIDGPYSVVRHEEVFLPSHKYVLSLRHVFDQDLAALTSLLREWPKGGEFGPVGKINLVRRSPWWVLSNESVFWSDDLAFKVRRKGWVVIRQTCQAMI